MIHLKATHYSLVLILIIAPLTIFCPVSGYEFVTLDDNINVYENPYMNPPAFHNTLSFWQKPYESLYIPMTYAIWSIVAWFSLFLSGKLNLSLPYSQLSSTPTAVVLPYTVWVLNYFLLRRSFNSCRPLSLPFHAGSGPGIYMVF